MSAAFHALIAAAGRPRQREDFWLSSPLGSLSVIRRIIHTFHQAEAGEIVVTTGYQARELERHLSRSGVICIRNEDWEHSDMMASVRLGLSYLAPRDCPILFTPADIPLFTLSTVFKLLKTQAAYAVPETKGKCGHPLLLGQAVQPFLLSYQGEEGLRGALRQAPVSGVFTEVADEGVLFDAERSEDRDRDCAELLESHRHQPYVPLVHVSLERELPFFDRTTALLLTLIGQNGSVKKACSMMGLSYSKGWDILNELELQAGIRVVKRRPGGSDGGASTLTSEGIAFLNRFTAYENEVIGLAKECFSKYFSEMEDSR